MGSMTEAIENKIEELRDHEWTAKDAKDYPACMYLKGAIIHFERFLEEMKEKE
jgi:hypothetical protein